MSSNVASDLPPLWASATSPDGRVYYYHTKTHETTWTKPVSQWKEYSDPKSNRKYYYNTETKKTQWECPPELLSGGGTAQAAVGGSGNSSAGTTSTTSTSRSTISINVTGASLQGANPNSSSAQHENQHVPEYTSVTEQRGRNTDGSFSFQGVLTGNGNKALQKLQKELVTYTPDNVEQLKTKFAERKYEERRAEFSDIIESRLEVVFEETGKLKMKWDELLRDEKLNPALDARFSLIETGGERKQIFHEVLQRMETTKRESARKAKHHATHELLEVLRSKWPGKKRAARFRDCYDFCAQFPCWRILGDDLARDEVFQEFQDAYDQELKEDKKRQRKENMKTLENMFATNPDITRSKITFHDVSNMYQKTQAWSSLPKADCLTAFENFLKQTGDKMLSRAKMLKFRKERDARLNFRKWLTDRTLEVRDTDGLRKLDEFLEKEKRVLGVLGDLEDGSAPGDSRDSRGEKNRRRKEEDRDREYLTVEDGDMRMITLETKWPEVLHWYDLPSQPVYRALLASNSGSTPQQLFEGHMQTLKDTFEEDKKRVESYLEEELEKENEDFNGKMANKEYFKIRPNTELPDFEKFVRRRGKRIHLVHVRVLWEQLVAKAELEKQRTERNDKKARQKLVAFLAENKEVGPSMSYEEAERRFRGNRVWQAVDKEHREAMFHTFIEQISKIMTGPAAGLTIKMQQDDLANEEDDDDDINDRGDENSDGAAHRSSTRDTMRKRRRDRSRSRSPRRKEIVREESENEYEMSASSEASSPRSKKKKKDKKKRKKEKKR